MDVQEYLDRIGAARPPVPSLAALRELQRRHLETVPFENLAITLGEAIELGEEALSGKLVRRRRGGICYELNGAFAVLLRALGFDVRLLGGRVWRREGGFGPPLDHLALRVDLGEPWLADVGFGRFSLRPLPLVDGAVQDDPAGRFEIRAAPRGDLDVLLDGGVVYRLEQRPRELAEFEAMAWWHSTSPRSRFTGGPTCSLATPGGRITLAGDRLIETVAGQRTERRLASDAEVLAAYREHFGIVLDRVPRAV
ncbi:MAG TPA: arylamine N-acetyltransferase [Amycolatopsis sp.]